MNEELTNDEVEIDLVDLGYVLLDKWRYLLISLIAGAVLLGAYSFFFIAPTYESTVKLYVVSASDDSVVNLSDLNLGTSLTADYEQLMLSYPVITSGEFAHRGSFEKLLGSRQQELGEKLSLEKQVTGKVPKTFIWHTFADQSVPVENSLLFVSALRRAGVPTEFHMYEKGAHGLALANKLTETNDGRAVQEECTSWIRLVHTWLESLFAGNVEDGLHAQGREW